MDIYIVLYILVLHFIGDFVFQNSWMALNKSKNIEALTAHCVTYWATFLTSGLLMAPFLANKITLNGYLTWSIVNFLLHVLVDFNTSRITSLLYKEEDKHWFFTVIGADQLIHYICLIFTFDLYAKI